MPGTHSINISEEAGFSSISAPHSSRNVHQGASVPDASLPWKSDFQAMHPFLDRHQRWADLPNSSGRPSSDLGDSLFDEASESSLLTATAAFVREDDSIPTRPSALRQVQCVGFQPANELMCTSGLTESSSAAPSTIPFCVERSTSCAARMGAQADDASSDCADGGVMFMGADAAPMQHSLRPPSTLHNPGIQLRISVPMDDAVPLDGKCKQGYAGLISLLHMSEADSHGTHGTRAPFIEAVCTGAVEHSDAVKRLVRSVAHGMRAQQDPEAAHEGMGGTYFLRDDAARMSAIFKPCDEEPLAPNNPKGWEGRAMGAPGMKPSVRVGEAAFREVAAYLLDHEGFAGVPPAVLAKCWHPVLNYKARVEKIESLMDIAQLGSEHAGRSAPDHSAPDKPPPAHKRGDRPKSRLSNEADLTFCQSLGGSAFVTTPQPNQWNSTVISMDGEVANKVFAKPPPSGLARALKDEMSRCSSTGSPAEWSQRGATRGVAARRGQAKVGSLQQYVTHTCDANDISPSSFSTANVHRVGILDVRIFNCDRHAGNLLVGKPKLASAAGARLQQDILSLIPIDHGFSLPEALDNPYFEWLYWPQASLPFGPVELAYIARLDVHEDIAMLRRLIPLLREECMRCLEVTTTVLQMCAAAGLTLFEIGSIMTRDDTLGEQLPSDLELMCMDAREEALATDSSTSTWNMMSPKSVSNPGAVLLAWNEEEDEMFSLDESPRASAQRAAAFPPPPSTSGCSDSQRLDSPFDSPPNRPYAHLPGGGLAASFAGFTAPKRPRAVTAPGPHALHGDASPLEPSPPPSTTHALTSLSGMLPVQARVPAKQCLRRMWRQKHARPAYPPHVAGEHPGIVNYVFSNLSAERWRVFMGAVRDWITEELAKGTWKQKQGMSTVAGSCPIFTSAQSRFI